MEIGSHTRALVTGGSAGIGLATGKALAGRGARVGLVARGTERLEQSAAQIGERAIALSADIGDREAITAAVDRFADEAGGIDVAVANAGVLHYAPFVDQPIEEAEQMVRVNVMGTIYTVNAVLPHMLDQAAGHIVVVSSGAGLRAFPWGAVYGATKAADRAFAEALRHELSGSGVSVTTVFPGEIATELHTGRRELLPDWRASDDELPAEDLAAAIVAAIEADRRNVYLPASVRVLGLNGIAPRLTDRLLAAVRGGTAAPRRD